MMEKKKEKKGADFEAGPNITERRITRCVVVFAQKKKKGGDVGGRQKKGEALTSRPRKVTCFLAGY